MAVAEGDRIGVIAHRLHAQDLQRPGFGQRQHVQPAAGGSGGWARFSRQVAQGQALRSSRERDLALLAVAPLDQQPVVAAQFAVCWVAVPSDAACADSLRPIRNSSSAAKQPIDFGASCCSATGRAARAPRAPVPAPRSAPGRKSFRARQRCRAGQVVGQLDRRQLAMRDRNGRHALGQSRRIGDAPDAHARQARPGRRSIGRHSCRSYAPIARKAAAIAAAGGRRVRRDAAGPSRPDTRSPPARRRCLRGFACRSSTARAACRRPAGPCRPAALRSSSRPAPQNADVRAEELVGRASQEIAIPAVARRSGACGA